MTHKTVDFSRFSSIRVGPVAEVLVLEKETEYTPEHYMIGGANNILVGPEHPPLMTLSKTFSYIHIDGNELVVGAATPGGKVVSFCKKNDIANFEFLSRLPGTIGGMLMMNAGLKEFEIFNHLKSITTDAGVLAKDEIAHGYRFTDIDAVIFEARFEIERGFCAERLQMFQQMRTNQPHNPSAGSCFKNPPGDYAGRLIEAAGLKGHRIGDMAFSEVHANFLVNLGSGTFEDAVAIIKLAKERVFEQFGIALENEIKIIDRRYLKS